MTTERFLMFLMFFCGVLSGQDGEILDPILGFALGMVFSILIEKLYGWYTYRKEH